MDIEKYLDHLNQDRQLIEQRITEERRLSEERIEKRSREFEDRLEKRFANIDQKFDRIDQKFDRMESKLESLSDIVSKESKKTRQWMIGIFVAVGWLVIATIIGISSIMATLSASIVP